MTHGHYLADLDPLELEKTYPGQKNLAEKYKFPSENLRKLLDYKYYGFSEEDLNR